MKQLSASLLFVSLFAASAVTFAEKRTAPELATGKTSKPLVTGRHAMVVTNNPWATLAAQEMLDAGGNAVDAAIAAGLVLGLTEPQSSGLGGGAYALVYSKQTKKMITYDGRETAPHSANAQWFLDSAGSVIPIRQIMLTAKAIGVPGEVALFKKMHQEQGKLAWEKLFAPAIKLAKHGFPMSPRMHKMLAADEPILKNDASIKEVYFTGEHIKPVGAMVKNPEYAATLKMLAANADHFYHGKFAEEIVAVINQSAGAPLYNSEDFSGYAVKAYPPVCSDYRSQYHICSVPPSTSGGVVLQELMGIYALNYAGSNADDPMWFYQFLEASKLVYADRNQYLADPDFVKQPVSGLLAKAYLLKRSKLVLETALKTPVAAGEPEGIDPQYGADASPKIPGTTSITIVDKHGNAISITATIESQFGSHIFTHGFFLNNELTDFSPIFKDGQGKLIANRIEPGKRPRSSITPVMVFRNDGQLYALSGSPGGNEIICFVAKTLILMLDMHKLPNEASAAVNLCAANNDPVIEATSPPLTQIPFLVKKGEIIIRKPMVSGLTNIMRKPDGGWYGAADPRREGMALGS